MLTLFEQYKNAGQISEALLVGRNLFNRNPGSEEVFADYYDYLCSLAETLPSFADRQNFAEQANIALAFFSENADLTMETVSRLASYQQRLNAIMDAIDRTQADKRADERQTIEAHNSERIKKLYALKDLLQRAASQEKFDEVLSQIGKLDGELDKDQFTDEQNSIYESLTKEHTEIISAKMRELEYKKNVAYNKQAADAYADAFKKFRENEGKYKNQTQLFALASKTLFAYDAARLFNETLIYYNHVYSYIFSKLDDDGKLALTRYSIECERKAR